MSSSRSDRNSDQAFILHSRPYRNTSLLVDAITREFGRLSFVAKGARQKKSDFYGQIQPFSPLHIGWGGSGELLSLFSAETTGTAIRLEGDIIYYGLYLNELLTRLLHRHDAHPEIYDAYETCLEKICAQTDADIYLRYFELDLLKNLGYAVNLTYDFHNNEAVVIEAEYFFIPEQGPVRFVEINSGQLKVNGSTLLALESESLSGKLARKEAKLLLRSILDYYLGGRPLKTRELFLQKFKLNGSTSNLD